MSGVDHLMELPMLRPLDHDAPLEGDIIIRIEFSPLVRIGVNRGHYWPEETIDEGPTRIDAGACEFLTLITNRWTFLSSGRTARKKRKQEEWKLKVKPLPPTYKKTEPKFYEEETNETNNTKPATEGRRIPNETEVNTVRGSSHQPTALKTQQTLLTKIWSQVHIRVCST